MKKAQEPCAQISAAFLPEGVNETALYRQALMDAIKKFMVNTQTIISSNTGDKSIEIIIEPASEIYELHVGQSIFLSNS